MEDVNDGLEKCYSNYDELYRAGAVVEVENEDAEF
jgi:hypothetical protein